MAAALLLAHPGLLAGATPFRPLSPFTHDRPHRLDSTPVLIIDGEKDTRRSLGDRALNDPVGLKQRLSASILRSL